MKNYKKDKKESFLQYLDVNIYMVEKCLKNCL